MTSLKQLFLAIPILVAAAHAGPAAQGETARTWPLYEKGVRWKRSLDDARVAAREGKKLVFLYRVVGDLDADVC